jgi:CBS domain-containing protein
MTIAAILGSKGGTVFTLSPSATLAEAAQELHARRVGALMVVDGTGGPAGILSERDIVRLVAQEGSSALAKTVDSVMTRNLVTATRADTADSALARMTDRRIRHLPVVEDGKLIGVVSIGDLVKHKINLAIAEADALRSYIATG